ncbi:MAG: polysaccharide deacetylase family protein [Proteobacteria bacterium]|nr:polysaccharide deacetylase family protein [Pseudomonadota bacterium]
MRHLVLKLDDIGRDSNRPVIDVVLWSMQKKLPVSIGAIGSDLKALSRELIELIQIAVKSGYVEVWNHGFRHIRYDQVSLDVAVSDLRNGHKAILDTFGIESEGFGFPFNCYTKEAVQAVRELFPDYFIYETDLPSFRRLTPEYNSFGDGQPRSSAFFERVGAAGAWGKNIVLQAHPPRWTKNGLDEFIQCVVNLVENRGYVCVNGRDAIESTSTTTVNLGKPSAFSMVTRGIKRLSSKWDELSDEYVATLPNFKSYFLSRFNSDTQKNWIQVRSELFPYRPQNILDIGCGLGNWSLPFWISGECKSLILNDINPTIERALNDGISTFDAKNGIFIGSKNFLTVKDVLDQRIDFLVSANTFNYLDPVDFFIFAKANVTLGGRLLLMIQTPAFNRRRYRLAFDSKDRAQGAEVLESDFFMLLRRSYGVFPDGFRHAHPTADVNRLANMFDFSLLSQFAPYGEDKEDSESVYECLLFRKTNNMQKEIAGRTDWLNECEATAGVTFGSKALDSAGLPTSASTAYFDPNGAWIFNERLSDGDMRAIGVIKESIRQIRLGISVNATELQCVSLLSPPISDLAEKVMRLSSRLLD